MRVPALLHLRLPLLRPFRTASGEVAEREIILVGVDDGRGVVGWGEAAPWPGEAGGIIDDVWEELITGRPGRWAAAALDEAERDLAARSAGVPLAVHIGGSPGARARSLAVGVDEDPAEAAVAAAAAGYATIKLKVVPGRDVAAVMAARAAAPTLAVAVDGNGSYPTAAVDDVAALAEAGAAYIEQPFAPGSHDAHRTLRSRVQVPVVLDEDVRSVEDAVAVIRAAAADILAVKPAALGLTGSLQVHDLAVAAGLAVKASGFLETSIGRAHCGALASMPGAVWSDVAEAAAFLAADPVRPTGGGGIGVEPDPDLVDRWLVRVHRDGLGSSS